MNKNILVHIVGTLVFSIGSLRGMQQAVIENAVSDIELACTNNEINEVKRLLSRGVKVNGVNHQGVTLLYIASQLGHKTITQLLLNYGAEVNAQSPDGGTALHAASMNNHSELCKILIDRGAHVDIQTHSGATALFTAVLRDSYEAASVLLNNRANPNIPTLKNQKTPIHRAIEDNNRRMVDLLLAHRADLSRPDKQGNTPLLLAAIASNGPIGLRLIEFHANCKGSGFYFSKKNKLLRKFLATLNARRGELAEEGAAQGIVSPNVSIKYVSTNNENDHDGAVNKQPYQIIPTKAKNNYEDVSAPLDGKSEKAQVSVNGHYEAVHVRQPDGYVAVPVAAEFKDTASAHYCSVLPRQPENSNDSYATLHKAATEGSCEDLEVLLSLGVPVDLRDDAGFTPLHRGVMAGQENSCKLLLAHRADRNLTTLDGKTALMLAKELQLAKLATLLESSSVNNSQRYGNIPQAPSGYATMPESAFKSAQGYEQLPVQLAGYILMSPELITPLAKASAQSKTAEKRYVSIPLIHKASQEGICEIIEMHLNLRVPVDLPDTEGYTPLHRAAMANQEAACKLLLSRGANRSLRTKAGKTAQMIAQEQGFKGLAALLG